MSSVTGNPISYFLCSYKLPLHSPVTNYEDDARRQPSHGRDSLLCPRFWRALLAECIGVILFISLSVGSSVPWTGRNEPNNVQIALANGLMIATLIQCFNHVSGAHFNPAVTLSFALHRDISVMRAICYIVAQCAGSTIGGLFLQRVTPLEFRPPEIGCSLLIDGLSPWQGFCVEFVITFQLVFMIFATMDRTRTDVLGSQAIAIGFSVATGLLYGIPYTGASMNPARSFGPALVTGIWKDQWLYWAAPISAGLCSSTVYTYVFANDASTRKLKQRLPCSSTMNQSGVTEPRPGPRPHTTYDSIPVDNNQLCETV